ncbi:MAG TPA: type II CAAX endopeptidase family protein [Chthoniobacteraceae bacterium]|jgi:membrane protease YdiL (CAAX protease family)|nr:type II CAAX endopeptidase family protein [Chthoniobacteraceae bacterium]
MSDDSSAPLLPAPIPWGFWATIGFGLIAMSAMVALQTLVLFIFVGLNMAYATGRQAPPELMIERLMHDPLMLCIGVLASVPVILGIVWLAVKRRPGWRLVDYLALRGFALRQFVIWFLVLAGVLWTGDQLLQSFGDDSGDAFIRGLLVGGRSVAPLLFAVTVAAPFIEELLFRGFMFRGLAASRAGLTGAIVLPNILWVSLHAQYARPTLAILFAMGLVLGLARHFSRSVTLPLVLHAMSNAVSTLSALWLNDGLN